MINDLKTPQFRLGKSKSFIFKVMKKFMASITVGGDAVMSLCSGLLASALIVYSGYVLYDTLYVQSKAYSAWDVLRDYKPDLSDVEGVPEETWETLSEMVTDYRAWITVYDTTIDYPVVQGEDDLFYARNDIYKQPSLTGAIYLATDNAPDFSDNYNMIYGHHMENRAMFGALDDFADEEYFKAHREGILITKEKIYDFKFFAVLKTDAYDDTVYLVGGDKELKDLIEYIHEKADVFDEAAASGVKKVIALSTCISALTNGRLVVFASLKERKTGDDINYIEPTVIVDKPKDGGDPNIKGNQGPSDEDENPDDGGNGEGGNDHPDDGGNGEGGNDNPDDGGNGEGGNDHPDDGGNGEGGNDNPDDGGNGEGGNDNPDDGGNGEDNGEDNGENGEGGEGGIGGGTGSGGQSSQGGSQGGQGGQDGQGGNDHPDDGGNGDGGNGEDNPDDGGESTNPFEDLIEYFKPTGTSYNANGRPAWALVNLIALIITVYILFPIMHVKAKYGRGKLMKKINNQKKELWEARALSEREDAERENIRRQALENRKKENEDADKALVVQPITEDEFNAAVDDLYYKVKKFLVRFRTGITVELVVSVVAAITFVLTENIRLPMVLIDRWTPLMLLFLLGCWITDVILARYRRKTEALEENLQAPKGENPEHKAESETKVH